jgi:phosphomannomutase
VHPQPRRREDTGGLSGEGGGAVPRVAPDDHLLLWTGHRVGVAAGVQITASHNPAADNGYKVFARGGRQILAPTDAEIRRRIDEIDETATGVAVADVGHAGIAPPDPEVFAAYVRGALRVVGCRVGEPRSLRLAYTPMHGVARDLVQGTLEAAGFRDLHVVDAQAEPDPDFPTVDFPNPEEPGALDALLALADEVGADVALANDPDGDRIAVVARSSSGAWRALSGDETGCLLADDVLARRGRDAEGRVPTTVVSSRLLARIASARNAHHVETLTGFKWLAAAALEEREAGREMALAYEQALGVMVGTHVLDKDGISAALAVADLADRLKAQGRGLVGALDDLARRHGLHVTGGRNIRLDAVGAPEPGAVIDRSRSDPPRALAGVEVLAVVDHLEGVRRLLDGGGTSALTTPSTPLVGLELEDGSRVQVRPSGTEPLLKCYGEVVETVAEGEPVEAARRRAEQRLAALLDALLEMAGLA